MNTADAIIRLALIGGMVLLLVGGLLLILGLWYLRGRDPQTGLVADIISEPPDDLPPGAVGTLLDEHADHEDVIATLLGLGRNGAVVIEAVPTRNPKVRDYRITLLHPDRITHRVGQDLLVVLFGENPQPMQEVLLSDVRGRFARHEARIRDDLYAELVNRGYFAENPHHQRQHWRRISWIGLALSAVIGIIVSIVVDPVAIATTIAAIIVWAVMVRVSRHMPRKTPEGAEAAAKWRAFKRYLQSIGEQRDLSEASDIFDRYFSYAIAFGIEREWIRTFSAAGASKPAWFGGVDVGDMGDIGDIGDVIVFGNIGDLARAGGAVGEISGSLGDVSMPDVSVPDMSMPDVQGLSDFVGGSLQGASDGLSGLLDSAGSVFDAIDFDL